MTMSLDAQLVAAWADLGVPVLPIGSGRIVGYVIGRGTSEMMIVLCDAPPGHASGERELIAYPAAMAGVIAASARVVFDVVDPSGVRALIAHLQYALDGDPLPERPQTEGSDSTAAPSPRDVAHQRLDELLDATLAFGRAFIAAKELQDESSARAARAADQADRHARALLADAMSLAVRVELTAEVLG